MTGKSTIGIFGNSSLPSCSSSILAVVSRIHNKDSIGTKNLSNFLVFIPYSVFLFKSNFNLSLPSLFRYKTIELTSISVIISSKANSLVVSLKIKINFFKTLTFFIKKLFPITSTNNSI
ncbi:hypothetical protein ACQ4LE_001874 [Meloidogyne hapla]